MENKTSTIVIINIIIFILYLKFGSMAFWVPAVVGFSFIAMFMFIVLTLQVFFIEFYTAQFLPAFKRVTGTELVLTTMTTEQRKAIKLVGLPLILLLVLIIWGLFRLLMYFQ